MSCLPRPAVALGQRAFATRPPGRRQHPTGPPAASALPHLPAHPRPPPGGLPTRSAYSSIVIGTDLLGAAFGHSHRTVATDLNLSAETVRGWLRRARRGIDHLHQRVAPALARVEPDLLTRLAPQPAPLAEALNLLFAASSATARTLHLETAEPWPLAAMICGGRLLAQTRPG